MQVEIKEVKRCRNGAYGNYIRRGRNSALITISREKNGAVSEYAATVLHELLHLWIEFLRANGLRCSDRREHAFIYSAEEVIVRRARKHLRRLPNV